MKLNGRIFAAMPAGLLLACIASGASTLHGASSPGGVSTPEGVSPLDRNLKLIRTDRHFTADRHMLERAAVMIELYYRMDEDEALLHDPVEPSVVFGRVPIRHLQARAAEDSLAAAEAALVRRVAALAETPAEEWTPEQKALHGLFPASWTAADAQASAARAVAKRGMRKTFRQSLERALEYQPYMDSVFRAQGVPTRLVHLAHIESWFKPNAVSPAGAAGIFQFLRSSGIRYLAIDELQDQRFDPLASTEAAARFLKSCQSYLGSWPLAIMAYNNGPGQISDAMRETGSREPSDIIRGYEAGSFKSVSRNYYAMFLAASSLALQADQLFPGLRRPAPTQYKTLKLEHGWTPSQLRVLSGYSTAVIRRCNPALRPAVFEKNLALPKGFELRLPAGLPSTQDLQFADLRIEAAPGTEPSRKAEEARMEQVAGVPVPAVVGRSLARIRSTLFPGRGAEDAPVMAYMHSQGLLDAGRLAKAKRDSILIEPHPALLDAIRNSGG
jgi:soluble lytic murein transglycosylase-like protein